MKKIMFSDKYGLTQAVLEGRKTMTRRVVMTNDIIETTTSDGTIHMVDKFIGSYHEYKDKDGKVWLAWSPFKVGEEVAIAQAYKNDDVLTYNAYHDDGTKREDGAERHKQMLNSKGYRNKMFVCADLMPHRIRITDIKLERLQDISDEDCLKEGIVKLVRGSVFVGMSQYIDDYETPREAFAALIDKVSGKGTWNSNPYVFAYSFELVK